VKSAHIKENQNSKMIDKQNAHKNKNVAVNPPAKDTRDILTLTRKIMRYYPMSQNFIFLFLLRLYKDLSNSSVRIIKLSFHKK